MLSSHMSYYVFAVYSTHAIFLGFIHETAQHGYHAHTVFALRIVGAWLVAHTTQGSVAMQRQEAVDEGREALTESAAVRSERLSSETRAEVAREFRKTLNRSRPSRKRYSVSSAHYSRQQSSNSSLEASGQFSTLTHSTRGNPQYSGSQFDGEENPFISSTDGSQFGEGGVSLGALEGGGEAIYREFEEHDSLSKFTNTLKKIVPQPIRVSLLPPRSWRDCRRFFFAHIPILQWLWTYRPNQLVGDLIAGITIGVTHIPQGKKDCGIIVCVLNYQRVFL